MEEGQSCLAGYLGKCLTAFWGKSKFGKGTLRRNFHGPSFSQGFSTLPGQTCLREGIWHSIGATEWLSSVLGSVKDLVLVLGLVPALGKRASVLGKPNRPGKMKGVGGNQEGVERSIQPRRACRDQRGQEPSGETSYNRPELEGQWRRRSAKADRSTQNR